MATFVHLTQEKNLNSIRKNGILLQKIHFEQIGKGVFCMPVIEDFYASHQWVRELMRFGLSNIYGVYFKIPDKEIVWYGRFNEEHKNDSAAKAQQDFLLVPDKQGFQVILKRKVAPKEIFKIKKLPPLGWRFYPAAKGIKPCFCPVCLASGQYGSSKMTVKKLTDLYKDYKKACSGDEKINLLYQMSELISDRKEKFEYWPELLSQDVVADENLFKAVGNLLFSLNNEKAIEQYLHFVGDVSSETVYWIVSEVMYHYKQRGKDFLANLQHLPDVCCAIGDYESWSCEE